MLIIDTLNSITLSYSLMAKRVTIMIDDDNDKKLRMLQAKHIQREQSSFSFSKTINQMLRKSLK